MPRKKKVQALSDKAVKVWQPPEGKPVQIRGVDDFLEQVERFTRPRTTPQLERNRFLFRGTADETFKLVPSLQRAADKTMPTETLYQIEAGATLMFARKAKLYIDPRFLPRLQPDECALVPGAPECQATGDHRDCLLQWWQLMQHHRAKTRLLDWTDSPFVALYFAAVEKPDAPGAVWMVENGAVADRIRDELKPTCPQNCPPHVLAQILDDKMRTIFWLPPWAYKTVPDAPSPQVAVARDQEARDTMDAYLDRWTNDHGHFLMFFPCQQPNERMNAQHGWFSCSRVLTADHGEMIAEVTARCPDRYWCQRLVIAANAKREILRQLHRMNITGESIYRGLDGLGQAAGELADLLHPDGRHRWSTVGGEQLAAQAIPTPPPRKRGRRKPKPSVQPLLFSEPEDKPHDTASTDGNGAAHEPPSAQRPSG